MHSRERRSNGAIRVQIVRLPFATPRTTDHWTVHFWTRAWFLNEHLHRHIRRVGTDGNTAFSVHAITVLRVYPAKRATRDTDSP